MGFMLVLKDFKFSVDFMPGLFEFQIFGRKNEGKVSRNLFLALSVLKLLVLFGIVKGVKKSRKESGSLLLIHLCMNIEAEYWKMSLNFRRPNIEKIGSVWELCLFPATLRTHFFCNFVILSSFDALIPPHARMPNSMWERNRLL